ncbi:MAG: hypothetical protein DME18_09850 [Verrucomicrobia bacterium]|nr:MAG: hypothetical protein DME18_09850 [Verrucomicrobiota bacterium]
MYKIIGADRKEYGPVTSDQINTWILEGRANGQTLVQAAGSAEWRALSSFPEFAAVLAAKSPAPPLVGSADPAVIANAALARGVEVNIGECLSRGWRLLLNNLALFLGASLLLLLIRLGLGLVPVIGGLAYLVIFGALYGGFYLIFLKRVRGEPSGIGDLFAGFSRDFVQFMLAGIVSSVLVFVGGLLCILPGIYLAVAWKFGLALIADRRLEFWTAMESSRRVITRYWFQIFGLLVVAYLPLVLFMGYSLFHMVSVMVPILLNSGGQFNFNFGQIMKMISGFVTLSLAQQLVALFTVPFATASLMHAYEDLFGTRPTPAA